MRGFFNMSLYKRIFKIAALAIGVSSITASASATENLLIDGASPATGKIGTPQISPLKNLSNLTSIPIPTRRPFVAGEKKCDTPERLAIFLKSKQQIAQAQYKTISRYGPSIYETNSILTTSKNGKEWYLFSTDTNKPCLKDYGTNLQYVSAFDDFTRQARFGEGNFLRLPNDYEMAPACEKIAAKELYNHSTESKFVNFTGITKEGDVKFFISNKDLHSWNTFTIGQNAGHNNEDCFNKSSYGGGTSSTLSQSGIAKAFNFFNAQNQPTNKENSSALQSETSGLRPL